MVAVTASVMVPVGLLVPSILIGATYGRLVGMHVKANNVDEGKMGRG